MNYFVYILYSPTINRYYVGQTNNLKRRLLDHNSGFSQYTKRGIPWTLVYSQMFSSRSEAYQMEQKIKKMKNADYIENLICSYKNMAQLG